MSAAASTPVYLAMTGAAARSVTAARWPLTPAQTFWPPLSTRTWPASGEIGNARAVICLAEGNPADALDVVHEVVDGKAPATGYMTVVEANLLASLAHRDLGDQRAAFAAVECALDLAEADRLVLPFAMTGSLELLAAMPRHQTAHPALLAGILDLMRGSPMSPGNTSTLAEIEKLSPSELRVLRYLPTNLSRSADCRSAVGVGEHRQHPHPQHLREAADSGSFLGRAPGPGDAAAVDRPEQLNLHQDPVRPLGIGPNV